MSTRTFYGAVKPGDMLGMDRHGTPAMRPESVTRYEHVADSALLSPTRHRVTLETGRQMTAQPGRWAVIQ